MRVTPNGLITLPFQYGKTAELHLLLPQTDPTVEEQVSRKKQDGSSISVKCPQSIVLYNKYMGGVDNDQLRGYYHVRLKCCKFYDVVITNSYSLCKHFTDLGVCDVKSFREQLAKSLISNYCSWKCPGRPSQSLQPSKRFCTSHFPVRGSNKQHRCHYCSHYKHERHGTVWYWNSVVLQ